MQFAFHRFLGKRLKEPFNVAFESFAVIKKKHDIKALIPGRLIRLILLMSFCLRKYPS